MTIGASVPVSLALGNGTIGYSLSSNIVVSFISEFHTGVMSVGTKLNSTINGPAFTPADAFMIDTKIDDGFPVTGKLRAEKVGQPVGFCRTPNNPSFYLLDDLRVDCDFGYIQKD